MGRVEKREVRRERKRKRDKIAERREAIRKPVRTSIFLHQPSKINQSPPKEKKSQQHESTNHKQNINK